MAKQFRKTDRIDWHAFQGTNRSHSGKKLLEPDQENCEFSTSMDESLHRLENDADSQQTTRQTELSNEILRKL